MLPPILKDNLALPLVGAPLFIISHPDLVIAQCKAGIVGSFPSLNARPLEQLDEWLTQINEELEDHKAKNPDSKTAPFAVNLIVHGSNDRLMDDIKLKVEELRETVLAPAGLTISQVYDESVYTKGSLKPSRLI